VQRLASGTKKDDPRDPVIIRLLPATALPKPRKKKLFTLYLLFHFVLCCFQDDRIYR
jgi:hypothetical protein